MHQAKDLEVNPELDRYPMQTAKNWCNVREAIGASEKSCCVILQVLKRLHDDLMTPTQKSVMEVNP